MPHSESTMSNNTDAAGKERSQFNYLLNAMERAAQEKSPAQAGYGSKRKALLAHVRELERKAAAYDALTAAGVMGTSGGSDA